MNRIANRVAARAQRGSGTSSTIVKLLAHLELETDPPPVQPARARLVSIDLGLLEASYPPTDRTSRVALSPGRR